MQLKWIYYERVYLLRAHSGQNWDRNIIVKTVIIVSSLEILFSSSFCWVCDNSDHSMWAERDRSRKWSGAGWILNELERSSERVWRKLSGAGEVGCGEENGAERTENWKSGSGAMSGAGNEALSGSHRNRFKRERNILRLTCSANDSFMFVLLQSHYL